MVEEEKENFDIDWLSERYPFDAEARNKTLEAEVLAHLAQKSEVTLVDVGAGTGSNCLYFVEQLPQNQKWFLVEKDAALKKATIRRLRDYASYHKYNFERKKDTIKISSVSREVTVTTINDSLLNLVDLVNLKKVDLVLANAVFDLFSVNQIKELVDLITQNKLAFYHTLSYEGMTFDPEDPFDDVFIETYNAHMERPQAFGKALGKKANALMVGLFQEKKKEVQTGESNWNIAPVDIKMHYYLLSFMENALGEMDLAPAMQSNFDKWVQRKKELIITGRQRLAVHHLDVFVK